MADVGSGEEGGRQKAVSQASISISRKEPVDTKGGEPSKEGVAGLPYLEAPSLLPFQHVEGIDFYRDFLSSEDGS